MAMQPGMQMGMMPGMGGGMGAMPGMMGGMMPGMQGMGHMGMGQMGAMTNPMGHMGMGQMGAPGGMASNMPMAPPSQPAPAAKEPESTAPDPDIVDLFDFFHIDPRHLSRFEGLMKKRERTFAGDMLKLWELLEQARSPEGMLVSKMREMECGTFIGKTVPDEELMEISQKFRLDGPAEAKLSDVLAKYEPAKRKEYIAEVTKHLEVSGKPSATVMMLLKKLGQGQPLGKPGPPAPGSYLDRQKHERDERRRPREDGYRPRSPGARGDKDRDRDRGERGGRERSRDRERGERGERGGRDRSRDRERQREPDE